MTTYYGKISSAGNGTDTLRAAVTGAEIVITAISFGSSADVDIYFTGGESDAAIFGDSTNGISVNTHGWYHAACPNGLMKTAAGVAFKMVSSGAAKIGGGFTYELIDA